MTKHTGIRTFEIVQYVSAPLPGGMDDWPANIQDQIFAALEAKSKQVELPLVITGSYCGTDYADTEGQPDKYYLHIVASEIIAADEREMKGLLG